jgi:hypothetical protein
MKKQNKSILLSLVIAFALAFAVARPVVAQNQDQSQPQAQSADQNQDQAQAQDPNQAQAQAQSPDQSQDQSQDQDQNVDPSLDPPNRIAQLNYTNGSVSFQPGGQGDWVDAVLNRPLTTGDNLWADKNSRAELHVGSTALRIDSETSLTFLTLNDQTTQLRLSTGALILRVRHLDDGDTFEVDTPNLAFNIQNTGEYRIDVNPDGNETLITVWQGRGEVTGGGYSYDVVANQQARFSGTDQLDHEIAQLPNSDDFDNWAFQRDQQDDRDESANYISTETTGYQDLDEYGHWHYVDGYGPVWTPAGIAVDWAPYRNGHWVFIAPWGWTWVEDEPWGFAPFHYGRWAFVANSWCWVPGPMAVRPIYSPAFVAFVGGGGFSIGVGVGPGVGWFPLAPGEVFIPWYRTSRVYVNNINITNTRVKVTQITNVYNVYRSNTTVAHFTYVNQRMGNGVTVVSRDTFVNARPVNRNIVHVDPKTIAQARVTREVAFQPGRPSVMGAGRPASFRPPAQVINRQVVGTRMPVTSQHPTFEPRTSGVNVQTQQPGSHPGTLRSPNQPAQPDFRVNQNPQPLQPQPGQNGQQRNFPRPPSTDRSQPEPAPRGGFQPMNNQQNNTQEQQRYVRPAPPVQQRNAQQQQNEEQKFHNWQEQRPKSTPAPSNRTQSTPRPQSQAPSHEKQDKPKH